ncbi:MAG: hypothetical protein QJR00_06635 [Bacillota bacterium]|nr:hypothetical protein [Bacillota bacterium]
MTRGAFATPPGQPVIVSLARVQAAALGLTLLAFAVVLGLFPMAIGLLLKSTGWDLPWGRQGGDVAMDRELKKVQPQAWILDHPSASGFCILSEGEVSRDEG